MLKVGKDPFIDKNGRQRHLSYADIETDNEKWVDCSKYLPEDFDLVFLKLESGRTRKGWLSGNSWDGAKIKSKDKVLYWKRNMMAM